MKCGLLSLALLGSPASGCWARSSVDGKRTEVAGRNWANLADLSEAREQVEQALIADEAATSARLMRVSGKRALTEACSNNVHFSDCSQDKGSAIHLERCLRERSGNKLSIGCRKGLKAW